MNEIVTLAERLTPLIGDLRHTTENDRCIAEPIVRAIRESELVSRAARHWRTPAMHTRTVVDCPRDAGGRGSVGFLVCLEQHAGLFLVPLLE